MKKLLLLSNSTNFGEPYLAWPKPHMAGFLGNEIKNVLFIPYAAVTFSYDDYAGMVGKVFQELGFRIVPIHRQSAPAQAVQQAEAIAVGGGNTFSLLNQLYGNNLIEAIREKASSGTPYIGWSAGSNAACPTIKTTNDMPIVQPPSFEALNLLPFQINPHYTEATIQNHGGESRAQRIKEFNEANPGVKVACLPEGSLLRVENDRVTFAGEWMKVFEKGKETQTVENGAKLTLELEPAAS